MDFLRQQLAVIQERLSGLTASQKMLTAALAVIVVMTMLYSGRFASTSERVALLPNALSAEDLASVTTALRGRGIDYTVDAGKVMVAADRQVEAFSEVTFAQALPANSGNALDAMFDKVSPWSTSQDYSNRLLSAQSQNLSQIIQRFPGVKDAVVVIADGSSAGVMSRRENRMSVNITTKSGAERSKIAKAARAFLLNTVAGLETKRLTVTIDLQTFNGGENDFGEVAGDVLALKQQFEQIEAEKLREHFNYIRGVSVQVTAAIDTSTRNIVEHNIDLKKKLSMASDEKRESVTPTGGAAQAVEPGVVPNTGISIAAAPAAPGAPAGNAVENTETKYLNDFDRKDTTTQTPAGSGKIVGATVGIPRSYLVAYWRDTDPKALPDGRPTAEQLAPIVKMVIAQVKGSVRSLYNLTDENAITVGDFFDPDASAGGPVLAAASPAAATNITLLATNHAKEVAIGVLAVTSLFMVSRMVKKAAPTPLATVGAATIGGGGGSTGTMTADDALAALAGKTPTRPTTINGEDIVGEVGDSSPVMFGQELDGDVLETSQMIEQVAGFVKQNPDAAAQMINQWMSNDD